MAAGADFIVWLGYNQGPIQLDPIYADYYVWVGGFKKAGKATWYLFLEHPCFHFIDYYDTLPLYWNSLRLMYRKRDFELSLAQYIHSDRWEFLSKGADWSTDLKLFKRFGHPLREDVRLFLDLRTFTALSRNYRKVYGTLDVKLGLELRNESGDFTLGLGYRPFDRTGIVRDAEGVPFLHLEVRGF